MNIGKSRSSFSVFFKKGLSFLSRFLKSYLKRGSYVEQKVPTLNIETTNACDAKCVFCANTIMQRKRQHLEMYLFQKAVDEYVAMQGKQITFNSVIGEPLLDPLLLDRARYVRQFSQIDSLGFFTNLHWLHTIDINGLLDSITWLAISVAFSGRQKYLEFFGVDRYEQTLQNVLTLIKKNNARKRKIELKFSLKPTSQSIDEVINSGDFKMVDSLTDGALSMVFIQQGLCVDDWLGQVSLPAYLWKRPLLPRAFRPCRLLYNSLIIFSNGNIGACPCRDFEAQSDLILGNIANTTLQEVWLGERIRSIRSLWRKKNKVPSICKVCAYYLY